MAEQERPVGKSNRRVIVLIIVDVERVERVIVDLVCVLHQDGIDICRAREVIPVLAPDVPASHHRQLCDRLQLQTGRDKQKDDAGLSEC